MAGQLGRVLVGGKDSGAGFALGPRLVVTAYHVVRDRRDRSVAYLPAGSEPIGVERVQPDVAHDACLLWLEGEVGEFLPVSTAVRGARWRVESPPPGSNDPPLHGTVTTARMTIHKAKGQRVEVVQLQVEEQLGDFGGYSGSAVLDWLGRAVLALLVEQKPLRTAVALGGRQAASNVLYAVPIGDVITACGLPVRTSRPLWFDVGFLPPGMVSRPGLLDEAVGRVIEAEGGAAGAGVVLLRGPGGAGKTVLARQLAEDVRVWAEFADGIIMLRAGQAATADGVARELQETLGYRDQDPVDVLAGQRLLLIIDDVWDRGLLGTLRANLPAAVAVLATTRGVSAPGAVTVLVGAVGQDEAIQILARDAPRSAELDQALGGLAGTLFRWPLLLTLAAAEIHRDDELDWGFYDDCGSQPDGPEPGVVIGRAKILGEEFPGDPTMLDDLERAPEDAAPRSVDALVRRSLDWLGPGHQARFELLAIYPPGAAITEPMLEDLWDTSPNITRKVIKLLVRAGLAQPVRSGRLTIGLHDLITAWLYHACGRPEDARHQPVHQRLAGLCLLADGSPGDLTADRADWLAYHLVAAAAWDRLKALPTLRWRSAFLVATGSDAAFLAGLDYYAHAALVQVPDGVYHAVRTWLFAAHVRELIGRLPIPLLVAMALAGDPIAVITQACQHPRAGEAVPAVLAAVADRRGVRLLLERAVTLVETIPDDWNRAKALDAIARRLSAAYPRDPTLIDQALAVAATITDGWTRSQTLAAIATRLAVTDTAGAVTLIGQALTVAETIPSDAARNQALAAIARRLAVNPQDPVLIERALAIAATITYVSLRNETLAVIARRLAAADPPDPGLTDQALAIAATITNEATCSEVLADIAKRLAAVDMARAEALFDRALAVARTISHDWNGQNALEAIAVQLAAVDPPDLTRIERALAMAAALSSREHRFHALADIAKRLAAVDPPDPALIERALTVAATIHDRRRGPTLAAIAERLAVMDLTRATALIDQALAIAEAIPDSRERNTALAAIAAALAADSEDPTQINEALAAAGSILDGERRSEALATIAQRLAPIDPARATVVIDQALTAAGAIPHSWERSTALAAVAAALAADPRDTEFIDQAVAVAGFISDSQQRGEALAAIARGLAAVDPPDPVPIERALAVSGTIPDSERRSETLATIAQRLAPIDPARATVVIDQALTAAGAVPDGWKRSETLATIAQRLAVNPTDLVLIERALAVAGTIPDSERRSQALAAIARRLAVNPRDPAQIDRALAVTRTISHDWTRGDALAAIADGLAAADPPDPALIDQAVAVAGSISNDQQRGQALAAIADRLAAADSLDPTLIERALDAAGTVPDNRRRCLALAAIAERLAVIDPTRARVVIDQALTTARMISNDQQRGQALAAIADRLAAADSLDLALIERALDAATAITNGFDRSDAQAAIARRLATLSPGDLALIERARNVAAAITDGWRRSGVQAVIARQLATVSPRDLALIERALDVAATISNGVERSQALAVIAEQLAATDPTRAAALMDEAVAATSTITDGRHRYRALTTLAKQLFATDPTRAAVLMDEAVAATSTISDRHDERTDALRDIARQLAAAEPFNLKLIDQAVAVAGTVPDSSDRSEALAAIAQRLASADPADPALIERALAVAGSIPGIGRRCRALARIHAPDKVMLDELSRWRLRSVDDLLDLLSVIASNPDYKIMAESIGRAVLEVSALFSVEAYSAEPPVPPFDGSPYLPLDSILDTPKVTRVTVKVTRWAQMRQPP